MPDHSQTRQPYESQQNWSNCSAHTVFQKLLTRTRVEISRAALSRAHWMPLGLRKATPHHTTHKAMEWWRGLIARYYSCCEPMWRDMKTGNNTCHWPCTHIELLPTPPQEFPLPADVWKAPPVKHVNPPPPPPPPREVMKPHHIIPGCTTSTDG